MHLAIAWRFSRMPAQRVVDGGPQLASKERVLCALGHRQPDRLPVDFGGTSVTGMHVSCVAALREYFGLAMKPVKVIDVFQMLGEIEEDLKAVLGVDTEAVRGRNTKFGFPNEGWKLGCMCDGLEVLVPVGFNVTIDQDGSSRLHPLGDVSLPPSARMPNGGYFFDAIVRQLSIHEGRLNPADNLEEFKPVSEEDLAHLEREARRAASGARWSRPSAARRSAISHRYRRSDSSTPKAFATSRNGTFPRPRGATMCTPCSKGNVRSRWRIWPASPPGSETWLKW